MTGMNAIDSEAHNLTIIDQFGKQAACFAQLPGHDHATRLLLDMGQVGPDSDVLDVACGPGLVACAAAARARHVVGVDLTPAMIEQARALQSRLGLGNVDWLLGDASSLPFAADTFSVALTRYSLHHFTDPARVVAEMARVARPGGCVVVADIVLPPHKAAAYDAMEKLRDPSHVRVLSNAELAELMTRVGLVELRWAGYLFELDLQTLLRGSFPAPGGAQRVRELFEQDVGQNQLGIHVRRVNQDIRFAYPIVVVAGRKPL
jgi:ubiquinone/menaquinone biosynthesis C-methylase UbiE